MKTKDEIAREIAVLLGATPEELAEPRSVGRALRKYLLSDHPYSSNNHQQLRSLMSRYMQAVEEEKEKAGVEEWDTAEPELVTEVPAHLRPDEGFDPVSRPSHYNTLGATCRGCGHPIECRDVAQHFNYYMGSAIKYVWRTDAKGEPIENLEKARQTLDFEIERRRGGQR